MLLELFPSVCLSIKRVIALAEKKHVSDDDDEDV